MPYKFTSTLVNLEAPFTENLVLGITIVPVFSSITISGFSNVISGGAMYLITEIGINFSTVLSALSVAMILKKLMFSSHRGNSFTEYWFTS
ncbi:hypothetical protein D3C85_1756940 [compost metagenome]